MAHLVNAGCILVQDNSSLPSLLVSSVSCRFIPIIPFILFSLPHWIFRDRHGINLPLHLVTFWVFEGSDRFAASAFRIESQSKQRYGNGNFFIAGESCRSNNTAAVPLHIDTRAAVHLALGANAATWKARSTRLTAVLAIETAQSCLSGATKTVVRRKNGTVGATDGAAED